MLSVFRSSRQRREAWLPDWMERETPIQGTPNDCDSDACESNDCDRDDCDTQTVTTRIYNEGYRKQNTRLPCLAPFLYLDTCVFLFVFVVLMHWWGANFHSSSPLEDLTTWSGVTYEIWHILKALLINRDKDHKRQFKLIFGCDNWNVPQYTSTVKPADRRARQSCFCFNSSID